MARLCALLVLLLLAIAPRPVRADDGAIVGVGGAIAPMKEHPSVRMVSERVVVELAPGRSDVDCLFRFRNGGPAVTVRMGFPESSEGTDVDPHEPYGFTRFESWVDGRPVPTRIEGLKGGGNSWERWRTKSVGFAAGQTRLVRVRYSSSAGRTVGGYYSFSYRLDTGGSWKGPIGRVEVIVHMREVSKGYHLSARPAGYRKQGETLSWRWQNLEPAPMRASAKGTSPEPVSSIGVGYYPGYREMVLDGQRLGSLGSSYALLEGSQLWASLWDVSYWLGGRVIDSNGKELGDEPYQAGTLLARGHTLRARGDSGRAMLDGKLIRLQYTPRMRQEHLFVPVNEVTALLGGSSWYDKAHERTFLFLSTTRPRDPYGFMEPTQWAVREKAELRRAERTADRSQSWRENPALAVTAGASLPKRLREKDAVRKALPGGAGKPDAMLTAGTARAEMTILEKTAKAARVRVTHGQDNAQGEVYLLERPFGRWWYVVGVAPQEGVRP